MHSCDNKNKYLKYKNKYLILKLQHSGDKFTDIKNAREFAFNENKFVKSKILALSKSNSINPIDNLYKSDNITKNMLYNTESLNNIDISYEDTVTRHNERFSRIFGIMGTIGTVFISLGAASATSTGIVATFGIGIPVIVITILIYLQYIKQTEYRKLSSIILPQLFSMMSDLLNIKLFYNYIDNTIKKHKEYLDSEESKGYVEYKKFQEYKKSKEYLDSDEYQTYQEYQEYNNNKYLIKLEEQIYKLLLLIISNLDVGSIWNSKGTAKLSNKMLLDFYTSYFDLLNPKYIFDNETNEYIDNPDIPVSESVDTFKLRYTSNNCTFCVINGNKCNSWIYDTISTTGKMTQTKIEKYCENYNDLILRHLESKIKFLDTSEDTPGIRVKNSISSSLNTNITIDEQYGELLREYAILSTTYSLTNGKYNIDYNKFSVHHSDKLDSIYPISIQNIIIGINNIKDEINNLDKDTNKINIRERIAENKIKFDKEQEDKRKKDVYDAPQNAYQKEHDEIRIKKLEDDRKFRHMRAVAARKAIEKATADDDADTKAKEEAIRNAIAEVERKRSPSPRPVDGVRGDIEDL